jgi:hypothetical protein
MATLLRRYDGTTTTYAAADMELLLAHLLSANSAGCSDGSVFFWAASPYLVLADLAFQVNRRLSELFEAQADPTNPFGLAFSADGQYYTLGEALLACGYAGEVPQTVSDLSALFMAVYQSASGGADSKVLSDATGSSLVATSGSISLPAHLKGLIGGQGVLLSESDTDITITANATSIATIGTGVPLIDPTSTALTKYLASLAVTNGLTLNRNAGVLSLGLGPTLTVTSLQSTSGVNAIGLSNSGARILLSGFVTENGENLGSFDVNNKLVLPNALQCSSFSSVRAEAQNFYVQGDDLAVPSGTRFKTLSDTVASLTTALETTDGSHNTRLTTLETSDGSQITRLTALENGRATTASVTALATRVDSVETGNTSQNTRLTALETSDTSQNTRLTSLETASTNQLLRITSLESTQASTVTQLNTNTTNISSIQDQISSLQTTSSSATTILPFAEGDLDARQKGIPQYSLYRNNVRGGFTMRYLADSAYQMNFTGGQSYSVRTAVNNNFSGTNGWTIEWWAKIPRLFQQTMVSVQTTDQFLTVSFGLTGGGAFNMTWNGGTHSLAQPEVDQWYLYGCMFTPGQALLYMSKQGQIATAPTYATVPVQGYNNLSSIDLFVGRDPSDYSLQGSVASPRIINRPIYQNYIFGRDALRVFTSFPLDGSPDKTVVVLDGNPLVNKVSPSSTITTFGSPTVSAVTDSVDNWVPP